MSYYIYITSCTNHTLFYSGVTNNLVKRIYQHKNKVVDGYTARYNLDKLLYFEECSDPLVAIEREKQIKKYSQKKKIALIMKNNPGMRDLYDEITDQ
ncbi:MAG: GIY-YIG nuclease family protein [Candidatus Berkelbacteria bacterium]|nr:GIY-YIG nuclease family protein [Candidatus Berkelbacteria bacterium]